MLAKPSSFGHISVFEECIRHSVLSSQILIQIVHSNFIARCPSDGDIVNEVTPAVTGLPLPDDEHVEEVLIILAAFHLREHELTRIDDLHILGVVYNRHQLGTT